MNQLDSICFYIEFHYSNHHDIWKLSNFREFIFQLFFFGEHVWKTQIIMKTKFRLLI